MVTYIPDKSDVVWLEFDPQSGHEQKGKRPAVVISPKNYNEKSNLALFCPVTSKKKGYPFEIKIKSKKISGVILSDQIRSLDWKARNAEFIMKASDSIMDDVMSKLKLLIFN